jgi:hypothetical protein
MDSSTSRHGSSDPRRWTLALTVLAPPLVWLTLLQTNYVLAYPACAARSSVWLHVPGAAALALSLLLTSLALGGRRRRAPGATHAFVADVGALVAVMFLVVVVATLVPPLVLHPCD